MSVKSLQSGPALCDPVDNSPPGSSVHGILHGLPCPPPGDLPDPGIKPASPALAGGFFTAEPPEKPMVLKKNILRILFNLMTLC